MMKPSLLLSTLPGLMFCSLAAGAIDLPDNKPGKWQTTIKHSSDKAAIGQPRTTVQCLDAKGAAEARQTALDYAKKNCTKNETRRDGSKWVTDMVCRLNNSSQMTTHSETTFSGDEAYHTEMTTTFEPPTAGRSRSSTIVDGKWLGTCKDK
jgi:hypothetical protein